MHHIVEKEPALVAVPMSLDVEFPVSLGVRGICMSVDGERVEVQLAYDVETTAGLSTLTFRADDVHWM